MLILEHFAEELPEHVIRVSIRRHASGGVNEAVTRDVDARLHAVVDAASSTRPSIPHPLPQGGRHRPRHGGRVERQEERVIVVDFLAIVVAVRLFIVVVVVIVVLVIVVAEVVVLASDEEVLRGESFGGSQLVASFQTNLPGGADSV